MGIHPAPSYANMFMAKLDDQIVKLANTYKITDECPLKTWKRFLDDIVLESGQILLRNYINSWMMSIKFILQSSLL